MRIYLPLSLLLVCLATAATLQVLNLDEMTEQSSAVVQGQIVAARTDWNDSRRNLAVTTYTVKADRYLKGNLGASFDLVEVGGQIGNHITAAPGVPVFRVGEELVLFVWTDNVKHRHQSIGLEQGAFRMVRDTNTGQRVLNHSQPLTGGGQIVESNFLASAVEGPKTSRDISTFLNQVTDSVRRVAARQGVRQ